MPLSLCLEIVQNEFDFFAAMTFVQMYKQIRRSQIAVILGYLVFQNQVIPKRVPGQLTQQAMVLMQVMSIMCEDDVGSYGFELFEIFLDLDPDVRKETIPKALDDDFLLLHRAQEGIRAGYRFGGARGVVCPEHDPMEACAGILLDQFQKSAAATDFDVVAVCTEA